VRGRGWHNEMGPVRDSYRDHARDALISLADKADDEPCSAVEAWALADALLSESSSRPLYASQNAKEDLVRDWSLRLRRRPSGAVREVSREVRESKAEFKQSVMTRFSKEHPAIPKGESA
jgi:hypothetical protein